MSVRSAAIAVIEAALAAIEAERAMVNDLNVYPVPDGDTGTNLALTVRAVLDQLRQSDAHDVPAIAAEVTNGSLMGARGNSGVILSQIVRGACEVWGRSGKLTAAELKQALAEGTSCAYRAVKEPVEGTMLTVVRRMAETAQGLPDTLDLSTLFAAVEEAGRVAVEQTTAQLAALQKAGVVDAGGYGLLVLFRGVAAGTLRLRDGSTSVLAADVALRSAPSRAPVVVQPSELSVYRYCTSLLLRGEGLDGSALEQFLVPMGDSTLVVGDEHMLKLHVHTDDPGAVLSEAVRHGVIGEIEINDMHGQTRARDDRLQRRAPAGRTTAIAVVTGDGNKRLFEELGCEAVVDGGQSMNPSAAQLLEAVGESVAEEIVLLPNNGNVILAGEQAAGMSPRHVAVVPSTSIPLGLTAMVAFDPEQDAVANARLMQEAIEGVHYAEVTMAVRDSELDGLAVAKGQAVSLVDGRLVGASDGLEEAFASVLGAFVAADANVVTVLTSLNGSGVSGERLAELAAELAPAAEVHFHNGGQPLYPILASAE